MEEKLLKTQCDYLTADYLHSLYSALEMPKNKIASLVKKGELLPVRRGLYLHGRPYERQYSKAVLSGIIYGPSAILQMLGVSSYTPNCYKSAIV